MATSDETTVARLIELIQQFFSHQISNNTQLSEAARESLQVAMECIEQAYSIQRRPASNELLEIFRTYGQSSPGIAGINLNAFANAAGTNPAQLLQNLASTFLSQTTGATTPNTDGSTTSASAPPPQQQSASSTTASSASTTTRTPKVRKKATEAEKLAAESFKNQGNDLMRQDKYKEAYDSYSQAIDIDDNNAIYYGNRAAASSKLGNLQATIDDCQEALEIDPNYSKAYGRLGFAYASMNQCEKARDAYLKAVELDPDNESHRNNLRSAEEQLQAAAGANQAGAGAGAGGFGGLGGLTGGANFGDMLRSVINNPEVMNMAMRSLQDPRVQSMFGLGGGGGGGAGSGGGHQNQNEPRQN